MGDAIRQLSIPKAIDALDEMSVSDALKAAGDDDRQGIKDYLSARKEEQDKIDQAEVDKIEEAKRAASADPAGIPDDIPLRYVALKGCPRSIVILGDQRRIDSEGRSFVVPGVQIWTRKDPSRPDIRTIDIASQECCRRAQRRFDPKVVAAMLQNTKYFLGDSTIQRRASIITEDEYQSEKAMKLEFARIQKAQTDQFQASIQAKRGKRGVVAIPDGPLDEFGNPRGTQQ